MNTPIKRHRLLIGVFAILIGSLFAASSHTDRSFAATGSDFQAGNIINDSIYFNPNSMSTEQIQAFLNAKVPSCRSGYTCLKDYSQNTPTKGAETSLCNQYDGGRKSAAQIIHDVATSCGINPQDLLVLLQKEQSLITDTWPEDIQYRSATGYGCPDTAACDSEYYGFFNQVYNAARQTKVYARSPGNYNYRTGRSNTILWNPNSGCGSSDVYIYSQATAGLYNYTPYRPNQAALNNLYGTGDGCSAYGNRNFWRLFTDWFGSTTGGIQLVRANSGGTTFAWYDGKKQGIPSPDVLAAWGLDRLPTILMDDASLATIPERPSALTRVAKNPLSPGLYLLADSGGTFDSLGNMVRNWGYDPNGASDVSSALIAYTSRKGSLTAFATSPSSGGIFAIDQGNTKLFSTSDIFLSWSKGTGVTVISDALKNQMQTGGGIFTSRATSSSGVRYLLNEGIARTIPSSLATLYPQSDFASISTVMADILPHGLDASRFIRSSESGAIYLVDNGTRHGIPSLEMLFAYSPSNDVSVTVLSPSEFAQIPMGTNITTRFVYDSSDSTKQYYLSQGVHTVQAGTFNVPSYGFAMSTQGISLAGTARGSISCAQGLVQATGSPGISILDNGVRRGIASINMLQMLQSRLGNVCALAPEDVNVIPAGQPASYYVSSGGVNYLTIQNDIYIVPTSSASDFGLSSPTPVSSNFLSGFTNQGTISSKFRTAGFYVFCNGGQCYTTSDIRIARLWRVDDSSPAYPNILYNILPRAGALTLFAKSMDSSNGAIYLVDNGQFLPISNLDHLFNAGFAMQSIPSIQQQYISTNQGSVWQGYLAKDATTNTLYVLEDGKKHPIPASLQTTWIGSSSPITPTTLSSNFLSLLQSSSLATKSVETNSPGIYGIDDGKKAGIPNAKTYLNRYAPALKVSDRLINSIPWGSPIASD